MTDLVESADWTPGIRQFETSDPVEGGPDGIDNVPLRQLANRTRFLKDRQEAHEGAVDPYPQYATKADLAQKVAALVDQSPEALNTLRELANALGNDPSFATTVTSALAQKAAIDSPVLTGTPKGSTPAQFDNSTRLATTAFVRSFGMQANAFTTLVGTATLTAANVGGSIYLGGAGNYTVTWPLASSVPAGARLEFVSGIGVSPVTLSRQGSDNIYMNANATLTSVPMALGDTYVLESNGTHWYSVGGSTPLAYTNGFSSSLSPSGYQKLPSGLIIQWGYSAFANVAANTLTYNTVTFPIAFPNTFLQGVGSFSGGIQGATFSNISFESPTKTGATVCISLGIAASGQVMRWFAIGY
ncbi:hypothetical protein DIE18_14510 [Burkholderia sp. Bp9125]|nr:hypothetical protein DIE18_14510 [Burkholderia sp. Bp9125]